MTTERKAYLIISPMSGLMAAVTSRERAEELGRNYAAVVCELPVISDFSLRALDPNLDPRELE